MWTLLLKHSDEYLTSCWLACDCYCSERGPRQKTDVLQRSNGPGDKRNCCPFQMWSPPT